MEIWGKRGNADKKTGMTFYMKIEIRRQAVRLKAIRLLVKDKKKKAGDRMKGLDSDRIPNSLQHPKGISFRAPI